MGDLCFEWVKTWSDMFDKFYTWFKTFNHVLKTVENVLDS